MFSFLYNYKVTSHFSYEFWKFLILYSGKYGIWVKEPLYTSQCAGAVTKALWAQMIKMLSLSNLPTEKVYQCRLLWVMKTCRYVATYRCGADDKEEIS